MTTTNNQPTGEPIPEKYLEFCKAVGRLCREAGLHDFTGSFRPALFAGDWRNKIEFHWEQGRHGAKNQEMFISSTMDTRTSIADVGKGSHD